MSMKKKSRLEKIMPYVLSVGMLSFVAACGSDDDDNNSAGPQQQEAQNVTYRAVLTPVNGSGATGTAIITRDADEFSADVTMAGAPSTVHMQHIHTGSTCATATNDSNHDGFVDAVEAEAVSGKALIPLDSDLRAQDAGGVYPVGRSYHYHETTSWDTMVADLSRTSDSTTTGTTGTTGSTTASTTGTATTGITGTTGTVTASTGATGTVTTTTTTPSTDSEFATLGADEPLRLAGRVV
jgi:hypothetical protein